MITTSLTPPPPLAAAAGPLRALWNETLRRQRTLALFGLFMLLAMLAMLPALLALGLDERTLRGVSVWVKPLKFMASIAVFSLTTAWFVGLLPVAERARRDVRAMVAVLVAAGSLEVAYITLQAALGQPSHYNFSDALHIALYSAMGAVAMALTATQLVLAMAIARRGRAELRPAWRAAVVLGLVMTFVFGAGAGGLLGSMQPPAGAGLPLVGWHLGGGDLRPAHFLGLHAQQLVPLAGAAIAAWLPRRAAFAALGVFSAGYAALWALAVLRGLEGAVLTVPMAA